MTTSDVNAILVQLAEIRGDVKAIRADNVRGEGEHVEFRNRIRSLEDARTSVKGAAVGYLAAGGTLGGGLAAALIKILGG